MTARCTAAERDRRVAQVVTWLGEGQSRANMLQLARGAWGIQARTVDAYLKRARELIRDETRATVRADMQSGRREAQTEAREAAMPDDLVELPSKDAARLEVLNMLRAQYASAQINGDVSAALKAAAAIAELLGLRWSDREDKAVGDEAERQRLARDAFAMMMGGVAASRAERGLPAPALPETFRGAP